MAGLVEDKVAIVTGAASGIGRASALLFASEGARVVAADLDAAGAEQTCELIVERGGQASSVHTDVTDDASVRAAVRFTLDDTPMLRAFLDADPAAEKAILATQPGGRLATPEEIGQAAVWLCSDRASFVTGESMLVDGGAVAR